MGQTMPPRLTAQKRRELIEARRNAFSAQGARDISCEGDVRDDAPAWMAEDESGHRVVYRVKDGLFGAYVLHNVGRYFALRNRPLQPPGKYTATARFSMWCVDRPGVRLDGIAIEVPYTVPEIVVDTRGERLGDDALRRRVIDLEERLRRAAEGTGRRG